jgi:hypothetical protein
MTPNVQVYVLSSYAPPEKRGGLGVLREKFDHATYDKQVMVV